MAFFDMRIRIGNHIDKTSYIILYTHEKQVTRKLVEKRIKYDIINLMRDTRVDKDVTSDDIANAICEWSTDEKSVELYSKQKVNGLWHTGATICIHIKNTDNSTETPRCPPSSPVSLSDSAIPFQENDIDDDLTYTCDKKKAHYITDEIITEYVDSLRTGNTFSTGLASIMKRLQIVDDSEDSKNSEDSKDMDNDCKVDN